MSRIILRLFILLWSALALDVGASDPNGTWFVRLRVYPGSLILTDSQWTSAVAVERTRPNGAYQCEIQSEAGTRLWSCRFDAPERTAAEVSSEASPGMSGEIKRVPTHEVNDQFTIRIPSFPETVIVKFFHQTESLGKIWSPVGEFILPTSNPAVVRSQAAALEGELVTLVESGPRANRINIVVVGDGFTLNQRSAFTNQAASAVQQFLRTIPISSYPEFFNAYSIFTPSAESGSDHPSLGRWRDTYFNSSYDNAGLNYLITIPPNAYDRDYDFGQGRVVALLAQHVPEYHITLMIVNDPAYGGSGGFPAIASVDPTASEILVHELGHSFAELGDEYSSPFPGYPDTEEPNTTRQNVRSLIKWRDWIDPSTPIPTPAVATYAAQVGLFEGAHYQEVGWFRPKLNCKMRSLGAPFCEVCREAIVLSLHALITPVDQVSPVEPLVPMTNDIPLVFSIDLIPASNLSYQIRWQINGVEIPGAETDQVLVERSQLRTGTNELIVNIHAATPFIRHDPENRLLASHSWTINAPKFGLRLLNAQVVSGNLFTFSVNRDVPIGVVEYSSDLRDWIPVATNSFGPTISGSIDLSTAERTGYFRMTEP